MVIVVGAGITGLTLVHELRRRGVDALVLEASARTGGVIRSEPRAGRVLEHGPQRIRLSAPLRALTRELAIEGELTLGADALPLYLYHAGALHPLPRSLPALLTTGLLSLRGKLDVLREPLAGALAGRDATVADFFTRRLGAEAYTRIVGPLFGGLYGGDPADMPYAHALLPLLDDLGVGEGSLLRSFLRAGRTTSPPASFRDGLETLTDALARRHADRLLTSARVTDIHARGSGWTVTAAGETHDAARVVLTAPAAACAALLRPAAPDAAERLGRLRYNRVTTAFLDADPPPEGLGFQVAFGEPLETRGVTFNQRVFPNDPGRARLCTAYLGSERGGEALADEWIGEIACNEYRQIVGGDARPIAITRARIPAWDHSWRALDGLTLPAGIHLCANFESRVGVSGRVAAATRLANRLAP